MTPGIQSIRIQGLRSLADVTLQFDGLTVLIGTNGSGKSSIIEALEILRRVATSQGQLLNELVNVHGALPNLLRRGASCRETKSSPTPRSPSTSPFATRYRSQSRHCSS